MIKKNYPKYKPSGVEWLGDVPQHWDVLQIKRIISTPITDGPHETPEILDEGIPFISAEAIRNNRIDFNKKRGFISEDDHRRYSLKYHPERNDIYMIKSGATTGNLAIVETDEDFNIWSPLAVIRCHHKKSDSRFILSAMNSREFQTSVQLFWSYGTQQNIGMNVIQNLVLPIPPLTEQQSIATFLDRETGCIDSLIEKKKKLIELLKEKRSAMITRAVTKGLDSSVTLKPSGVEWLGEIPEHWDIKKLKNEFYILNGSTPKSSNEKYWDGTIVWYTPEDLGNNTSKIITDSKRKITREGYASVGAKTAPQNSIIISTRAPIGHMAITSISSCTNQGCRSLVPRKGCSTDFYYYYLFASKKQLNAIGKGTTFIELSTLGLGTFNIVFPPLPEQQAIATFLDRETVKIDKLVTKVETAIDRLKEYRISLISSAVTGKIDVRDAL